MAALGSDAVEVIDVKEGKVVDRIKGLATPQGVAFGENLLAVANDKDGSVVLFDGATFKETGRVDLKDDADNVRFDAGRTCFWVGYGDGGLAAIGAAPGRKTTGKKTVDIRLDGHPESFQLESQGERIFVNVPGAGQVAVIDRAKEAVIAKWRLKGAAANFPMALDETHRRVFIGCRRPAKMLVLDMQSGAEVAAVDCVGDTDDLFYDAKAKRIYVIGGAGAVDVIEQVDADHYRALATVKTAAGARTGYFAAGLRKLFVAVPHRGGQEAEVRVYEAGE